MDTAPVTIETLKEHFTRLGLSPSDEDFAAMLPAVERLEAAAREIEAMLPQDAEPGITLRLPE